MSESLPRPRLERWPIAKLRVVPGNPRRHDAGDVAALVRSMRRFGFTAPVLATPDGELIVGEARLLAARSAGQAELPVIVIDWLDEAARRAYRVADNQLAALATWDEAALAAVMQDLADIEFDLGVLGFATGELAQLLGAIGSVDLPALPSGERAPFQQLTFTLHDDQVQTVKGALAAAKAAGPFVGPNANGNGNALARIAEHYLGRG